MCNTHSSSRRCTTPSLCPARRRSARGICSRRRRLRRRRLGVKAARASRRLLREGARRSMSLAAATRRLTPPKEGRSQMDGRRLRKDCRGRPRASFRDRRVWFLMAGRLVGETRSRGSRASARICRAWLRFRQCSRMSRRPSRGIKRRSRASSWRLCVCTGCNSGRKQSLAMRLQSLGWKKASRLGMMPLLLPRMLQRMKNTSSYTIRRTKERHWLWFVPPFRLFTVPNTHHTTEKPHRRQATTRPVRPAPKPCRKASRHLPHRPPRRTRPLARARAPRGDAWRQAAARRLWLDPWPWESVRSAEWVSASACALQDRGPCSYGFTG